MSVRTEDRNTRKLEVLELAKELKAYSFGLLSNPNHFPKSKRWITVIPMMNALREVVTNIRRANSVNVSHYEDYTLRRTYQMKAHANLDLLYDYIDEIFDGNYLEERQIVYWLNKVQKLDNVLKRWIRADENRTLNLASVNKRS